MANAALILPVILVAGAAFAIAWRAGRQAPPPQPLSSPKETGRPGRIGELFEWARIAGPGALTKRLLNAAKQLTETLETSPAGPHSRPAAALPPILAQLKEDGTLDDWLRHDARRHYRGPSFLFPIWYALITLAQTRAARELRYLDLVTQTLEETVNRR